MATACISIKQTESDAPNCSICTELLVDPRALPCGHSFCGSSKNCLGALKKPGGLLKCAIFSTEYRMNIEDVKPLFGIREHLEGYSSEIGAYQKEIDELRKKMEDLQNASSFEPPVCSQCLCDNSVSFWCKECEKEMCDDCLETHHDKHSVVAIKKHLRREVEKKLSKVSLKENYTKTGEPYECCS